jgi:hypothetical protein
MKTEQFLVIDSTMILQPADVPELGGNGGLTLENVEKGKWVAQFVKPSSSDSDPVLSIINEASAKGITPVWVDTGIKLISDVNVLCLLTSSAFPQEEYYSEWWNSVVLSLEKTRLASVKGGIVVQTSDGEQCSIYEWRESDVLIGIQIKYPLE